MTTTQLTPAQHAILTHAVEHTSGKIEWFPDNIKGGARKKVLDGLFNRALITTEGTDWFVAAKGYDALGVARPGLNKKRVGQFEANLDRIIANAEAAPAMASDPELEAAVTAAEATWVKPRTRENSKQAEVIRMLQRPEGATIGQICTATGWQAHTVRGTFAGAFKKKLGLNIVSDKPKGGERIYRIA
ncbi:TPA: DUF3489 domain-containing protein [Pseudomonas aeruginosa]|nr:DUF3489 domain-containing protein [Pseudomonas aeruginosa]HEP9809570.1 DUF3489 domain-containing protein [Pseudomonas aeruginosa]HEP9822764.1 DUF3489 domain-containing protein [Pseudomonas aeruginosa]HEP9842755.1 DUF3489 domain-containing protein [Pseudomonas aeruginosa]HEP9937813.1 DUF3489 domain-containing protein [Pseudomonas aeruginosa]